MNRLLRIFGSGRADPATQWLQLQKGPAALHLVPNRRARRYILRVLPDASVRVTIPRGGSKSEAVRFAERCRPWIERQVMRQVSRPRLAAEWTLGTIILFRGEPLRFEAVPEVPGQVRLGPELIQVADRSSDFRRQVEGYLRLLAGRELPPRVAELAAPGGFRVQRVSIRNQRSRWGSCSRRGTLSLNWRLIQAPPFVRDYIIYHELAHLREMNHSPRFWAVVGDLCPDCGRAEQWLKSNAALLR